MFLAQRCARKVKAARGSVFDWTNGPFAPLLVASLMSPVASLVTTDRCSNVSMCLRISTKCFLFPGIVPLLYSVGNKTYYYYSRTGDPTGHHHTCGTSRYVPWLLGQLGWWQDRSRFRADCGRKRHNGGSEWTDGADYCCGLWRGGYRYFCAARRSRYVTSQWPMTAIGLTLSQSPCIAPTAGICLPLGLCKGTVTGVRKRWEFPLITWAHSAMGH